MRYLITGHTGFKGSWLVAWLSALGHEVCGLSLDPAVGGLYERARLGDLMYLDARGDIRDAELTARALRDAHPDVVIHLAAQPLVRESYRDPRYTWETNVVGTLNVLDAASAVPGVAAVLVITTDKVYRNVNQIWGYREDDPLGGHDPYSASKAAADILAQSWMNLSPRPRASIARAGNVIGGGDVCPERLMVDLVAACSRGERVTLRFPEAVRPWQHVLDCLAGYLTIVDSLVTGGGADGEAFNIGPGSDSFVTVDAVARHVMRAWGIAGDPAHSQRPHPAEAGLLALDPRKAETRLGWRNRLSFQDALTWTVEWEKSVLAGGDARTLLLDQIAAFRDLATAR